VVSLYFQRFLALITPLERQIPDLRAVESVQSYLQSGSAVTNGCYFSNPGETRINESNIKIC
jgi:hypothetical protein